jgi:hypothetical protein
LGLRRRRPLRGGQVNASWNADALQVFLVAGPEIPEGRKQYGTLALGHVLALHKGYGYFAAGDTLRKFDLAGGRLSPIKNGRPEVKVPGSGVRRGLAAIDDNTLALGSEEENKLYLLDSSTAEVGVNNDVPTESHLHPNGRGVLVLE